MEKNLLIAGKEFSDASDFVSGIASCGRNVITTITSARDDTVSAASGLIQTASGTRILQAPWNCASPVSAHALVLGAENVFDHLDEAVLFFDEAAFAVQYDRVELPAVSRVIDMLISGYQYLTCELISRYESKKMGSEMHHPGKLVFVHKVNPSVADAVRTPAIRGQTSKLSTAFVAAAASAFDAFSENIAAATAERSDVETLLVVCDQANEIAQKDSTMASWLCNYLDGIDALKCRLAPKHALLWIKAGAKSPRESSLNLSGGLNIFR
jgi:hypothetical protein